MAYEIDEKILEKIYIKVIEELEKSDSNRYATGLRDFINLIESTNGTLEGWEDDLYL